MSLKSDGKWAVQQLSRQLDGRQAWSNCTIFCGYETEEEAWATIPGGRDTAEFRVVPRQLREAERA